MRIRTAENILIGFVISSALAGPLKLMGSKIGFPIHLLPKALLLWVILDAFVFLRAQPRQWLVIVLAVASCVVAIEHGLVLNQILFGFWTLLPFIFGLLFPGILLSDRVRNKWAYVFILSVAGELLSYLTVLPWNGLLVEFGGVATSAAREWSDGANPRLAGLATSSIDLSLMLAIFGMMLFARCEKLMSRMALFSIVGVAIYFTTMKTALAAYTVASVPLLIPTRHVKALMGFVGLVFMSLGVAVPFLLDANAASVHALIKVLSSFQTLQDRIDLTWPGVLTYLHDAGVGFWGIGIGGLGTATNLAAEPLVYASVDNCYLYLLGTGGVIGAVLLLLFFARLSARSFHSLPVIPEYGLALLIFFAVYGCAQPIVETSVSALYFGALLARSRVHQYVPSMLGVPARPLNFSAT